MKAAIELMETAVAVEFEVTATDIVPTAGGDDTVVRITAQLGEPDDEEADLGSSDQEWGGLPFIFALMVLSFHDARPRGVRGKWYEDKDQFNVADLLAAFRFDSGCLSVSVDYLRGRCVKTDITPDRDGRLVLATRTRGEAATRWFRTLKGERTLQAV